jgi:hypothetical protein
MVNSTIYDSLKGKYVRVFSHNGATYLGCLKYVDYDKTILNPHLSNQSTPRGDEYSIVDEDFIIGGPIHAMGPVTRNYLQIIVDSAKEKLEEERKAKEEKAPGLDSKVEVQEKKTIK